MTTNCCKQICFPGTVSNYHGFKRYDFCVDDCDAIAVEPRNALPGRPWIWRAEFFDAFPGIDLALLAKGFHLGFIKVGNTFGCPDALKHWDVFYHEMTEKYQLGKKPVLEGLSRGGLYIYNWAAQHPHQVGCLFCDAPVCDFKSWPGGKVGRGKGSEEDWRQLLECYHFASEQEALEYGGNPVDNLEPIIAAAIPSINIYGDADEVVPFEENTKVLQARYEKLGASLKVIRKPGIGHHPHGLTDPTPVVDFIMRALKLNQNIF